MSEEVETKKALITFDVKTLQALDDYAKQNFMGNRSQAANYIIDSFLSSGNLLKYLRPTAGNEKKGVK